MTTRITESNIEPGSVTANIFSAGVTLGGGVTIDQIIVTDANFANTEDTQLAISGGYLKLYGSGFEANANVYISNTFSLSTQVTANVISSNEVRLTVGGTSIDTYNLFLINNNGSLATKVNAITTYVVQPDKGWWGGGNGPGTPVSTVERLDFNDDTSTATVRGPLSQARAGLAGFGTISNGWYAGGSSTIDRITFSSDTNNASVRGFLNLDKSGVASVEDDSYGWTAGGESYASIIQRTTFSDDTTNAVLRGPLVQNTSYMASADNETFGYFGGGRSPTAISTVQRITFSSDTSTATTRGPLSYNRPFLGSVENDNYGWFVGGSPGPGTTVDRVDFANDNTTASVRGNLAYARYLMTGASNQDYGWVGGGLISGIDRINFASDTGTASIRGNFTEVKTATGATSGKA
jgi:hypothetical protein